MSGTPHPPPPLRGSGLPSVVRRLLGALTGAEPEHVVYLGLGSNLGDRLTMLQQAVDRLAADHQVTVLDVSSVYETEPVGGPEQDPYLNIAVRISTTHGPKSLLRACGRIEADLGRTRTVRWGPRTIDVDVLLYAGGRRVDLPDLQVPHPRLTERPFALIPLIEVAPGERLPDGRSLTSALTRLAPVEGVGMVGAQVRVPA